LSVRQQLLGTEAIAAAMERGDALRRIVVCAETEREVAELLTRARSAGIAVQRVSSRSFARLRRESDGSAALGLVGPPPDASQEEVLQGNGVTWQLVGGLYPGNAGMAVRTAEVSGASGAFIDAGFDRAGRRAVLRASMRADRFMPVFFCPAEPVIDAAARRGRRIIAIEDVGDRLPWEVDLTGRVHCVVGGEASGIPEAILGVCDEVVRIPTSGFVPSYNLQGAVAAVASEHLRQLSRVSA
jgi:tRNA G18 (ribose-2'-O)-methylase SpoU